MKRLAVITTHPIQYHAPWFRLLTARNQVKLKVFYTWGQLEKREKFDPGFGKNIEWDIPLLEGYEYAFVKNISRDPGSHHFIGIDNPSLIRELDQWGPDAILVFGWAFKSHLKVLRHYKGKKIIIFRGDSNLLDQPKGFSFKKAFRHLFLRWVYAYVDTALYVGTANKQYFHKFGLKPNQLVFAPHAIDNNRFLKEGGDEIRKQLHIPVEQIVFLYAGKFEPKKNIPLLLDVFIEAGMKEAHLVLVGNGPQESVLKEKARGLEGDKQATIHFMDFQNQAAMPSVYGACDVFVLPSKGPGETWGLAVNEAMASGKAVLVSDQCGCAVDLVKAGINGYIFESGNTDDLVAKMKYLYENRVYLPVMGKASKEIIQDWSFENICKAVEETLSRVP